MSTMYSKTYSFFFFFAVFENACASNSKVISDTLFLPVISLVQVTAVLMLTIKLALYQVLIILIIRQPHFSEIQTIKMTQTKA